MPVSKPLASNPASRANKSLDDGLKCLQWILTQRQATSLQDLAKALGFETTRAHRLLKTFVQAGFLQQTSGRKYEPGPAMFHMAMHALHDSHLLEAALPPLERLRYQLKHRVAMGLLWSRTVSYLYHAEPSTPIEKAIGGCGLYSATNSGIGLVALSRMSDEEVITAYAGVEIDDREGGLEGLLKELAEIRKQGYAFMSPSPWTTCTLAVSLPSNPLMAVAVAGKIEADEVADLLPLLRQTVADIEIALHPSGPVASLQSLKRRRRQSLV